METTVEKSYVVGVDIGGQTTKIGIVDRRGNILDQTVINSKYGANDAGLFMESLCSTIRELVAELGLENVKGVGIGAPNANYYTGTPPRAQTRSSRHELPVKMPNDANAAAMGEMTYGAARGMKNFIMITLGTGVGSGIVINGDVVYGHDGFAGELGHTCAVRNNGRLCNCGKYGCLEAYASAVGVARTAREWLDMSDEPSLLRSLPEITSKDVYEAAVQGDRLSVKIFDYTGKMLGRSFADFVAFSAPEAIILFGGLARAGELLIKPIREEMNANLLSYWKNKVAIIQSALKESDAAILGASALAW